MTIMRDPSGTSRGFAFLTFEDPSAVQVVTAQDHFLDGKAVCFFVLFVGVAGVDLFRLILNARFHVKSTFAIRAILLVGWHRRRRRIR